MYQLVELTPETRFEVTRIHQADYAAVAAGAVDTTTALAAQWVSDLDALQGYLWQTAIIASIDYDAEFEKITNYIRDGLVNFTKVTTTGDALGLLHTLHRHVADMFADSKVLTEWDARCFDAEFLRGRPTPSAEDWAAIRTRHIGEIPLDEAISRRADSIATQSRNLITNRPHLGDQEGHQKVWELDWTVFHAYLLEMANLCGDDSLLSVDLRWQVAQQKMAALTKVPMSAHEASSMWRRIMSDVVGPLEAPRLGIRFLQF